MAEAGGARGTDYRSGLAGVTRRRQSSDGLDGHCHRTAAAQAEGGQTLSAAAPPKLVEERRQDSCPRRPDGMAQCDGAAVHVDLVPVEAELVAVRQHLGREGLVDLDQVEVIDGAANLLDQPAYPGDRRLEEPFGRH